MIFEFPQPSSAFNPDSLWFLGVRGKTFKKIALDLLLLIRFSLKKLDSGKWSCAALQPDWPPKCKYGRARGLFLKNSHHVFICNESTQLAFPTPPFLWHKRPYPGMMLKMLQKSPNLTCSSQKIQPGLSSKSNKLVPVSSHRCLKALK